jgi:hypothetical protein
MTEAEWLACDDPRVMLLHLATAAEEASPHAIYYEAFVPGSRKLRLFGCACVRRNWGSLRNWVAQSSVEVTEKVVDGALAVDRLKEISGYVGQWRPAFSGFETAQTRARDRDPALSRERLAFRVALRERDVWPAVADSARELVAIEGQGAILALVRDVFGNPFRSVLLPRAWQTSDVLGLAEGAYATRSFDHLPILADALEDAGCDDAALLGHLRGPGPHVRGCWALDLILGKS